MTDDARSYYGRPVLKAPVWRWYIPAYFFTGGLSGASATLALGARVVGDDRLARRALCVSAVGAMASPPLLIADLGRPERFVNMLRVAKPTSPMSVGTWVISAFAPAVLGALTADVTGRLPRLGRAAAAVAGVLGPVMCTYTAVLLADTAVPVWHGAQRELPFVFAGSAAASAGAGVVLISPVGQADAARRMMVAGAVIESVAVAAMERAHPDTSSPYEGDGRAAVMSRWARGLTLVGAALATTLGRRRRSAAVVGASAMLAGSLCERFSVAAAGVESALDPDATVGPQRRRAGATRR